MQPEKLSEKASKIVQEAEMFEEALERFGPSFEKLCLQALRRSASKEVEQSLQKVMQEVTKKNKDIVDFPLLYGGKEVWVCATSSRDHRTYLLSAEEMKKESALQIAAKLRREAGCIYLPVPAFQELVAEVQTLVNKGKLDEKIHLAAEHLIYDIMYSARQS